MLLIYFSLTKFFEIDRPVLLGGVYKLTNASQGKDGSATDVMASSKKKIHHFDLQRMILRHKIPLRYNTYHPNKTIHAQRILCNLTNNEEIRKLANEFYEGYWVNNQDLSDMNVLKKLVIKAGVQISEKNIENPSEISKQILMKNTEELVEKGGFGVPSYYLEPSKK